MNNYSVAIYSFSMNKTEDEIITMIKITNPVNPNEL